MSKKEATTSEKGEETSEEGSEKKTTTKDDDQGTSKEMLEEESSSNDETNNKTTKSKSKRLPEGLEAIKVGDPHAFSVLKEIYQRNNVRDEADACGPQKIDMRPTETFLSPSRRQKRLIL